MIIRSIDGRDIGDFIEIKDSKGTFYDTMMSWLEDGITKLEWCFIVENSESFLGRIVYGVYDDELEILDINLKDATEKIVYKLLQESLEKMKEEGFTRVGCHLYSDKKDFTKYIEGFMKAGFKVTQEKKSFIWEEGNIVNKPSGRLTFKGLEDMDSEEFIDAIEKVTEGTLDSDDLECVEEFGSKEAATKYFNQLKEIDFNEKWWKLAYAIDCELIGLIIPQKFNDRVGAINYIGVVPEYRGNDYVRDLLIEGIETLRRNNIEKIIADIDVKNYPLDKALIDEGFKFDCSMLVLKLDM